MGSHCRRKRRHTRHDCEDAARGAGDDDVVVAETLLDPFADELTMAIECLAADLVNGILRGRSRLPLPPSLLRRRPDVVSIAMAVALRALAANSASRGREAAFYTTDGRAGGRPDGGGGGR